MENITQEQAGQLKTWASERDAILLEISGLKDEKEKLIKQKNEVADSATEIETKVQQFIGRMEELDKQEKEYNDIVSAEISKTLVIKTTLESTVTNLKKEVDILIDKKAEIEKDILFLENIQKEVFTRTGVLEKVVEHVTSTNSLNMKELEESVIRLKDKVSSILELSDTNIKAHTDILDTIPRLFVELQKKSLIRQKI